MSSPGIRSPRAIVAVLVTGGLSVAVMMTLVIPLMPEFPKLLGVSHDDASWLVTVTLLTSVVATPSLGRMADMYGKRRMLLVSLAAMAVGSLIGAIGGTFATLLIARTLQGLAIAFVPVGMSIMRDVLPAKRLPSAVALVSSTIGVGAAIGLPLSGILYANLGWKSVFWLTFMVGAALFIAVPLIIPASAKPSGGRFDALGAVLLGGGLGSLLLAITKGDAWGWTGTATLITFAVSVALFSVWIPWERRVANPLVDLYSMSRAPVMLTNIASFTVGFGLYCNLLATSQLFELDPASGFGFGLTAEQAGIAMIPTGLGMMILAPVSAIVTNRFGPAITLLTGGLVFAVTYLLRIFTSTSVLMVALGSLIVAGGIAFAHAPQPVIIMRSVPASETSAANSLNTVLRSGGTSTSSATVVAVLASTAIMVDGEKVPSSTGFAWVFALSAAAGLVCAGLGIALLRIRSGSGAQSLHTNV